MSRLAGTAGGGIRLYVDLPSGATCGDITAARGAIIEATTGYVDWERLYEQVQNGSDEPAISGPGRVLLAIATGLKDAP